MRSPLRRRRFNYAGDAAGLIEGERTGAKKTGQRDRTRRNRNAPRERRIGCRRIAGDYRNGGADAGPGRRVTGIACLRCNSLDTDSLTPRAHSVSEGGKAILAILSIDSKNRSLHNTRKLAYVSVAPC
jgi:hypothetical protein